MTERFLVGERGQEPVTGLRILLVDDEQAVREPIAMLLEIDQHIVTQNSSGQEAIKTAEQSKFDLLITDGRMDGMTGDQLAIIIKDRWPKLPVLMLTGFAPASAADLKALDGILYKPCSLSDLRAAIKRVCAPKRVA